MNTNEETLEGLINIRNIKRHGATLGLEAELTTQLNWLRDMIKDRKWLKAATHAINCKTLLDELHFLSVGDRPCEASPQNSTETTIEL